MRKKFEPQLELGSTPIAEIEIPLRSRDELPPVLRSLQQIFCTPELSQKIFEILQEAIPLKQNGRPGANLWEILVLGVVGSH